MGKAKRGSDSSPVAQQQAQSPPMSPVQKKQSAAEAAPLSYSPTGAKESYNSTDVISAYEQGKRASEKDKDGSGYFACCGNYKGGSFTTFLLLFILGAVLLFCSTFSLATILVSPHNFAYLFASGSMTMIGSFVYYRGPGAFFGHLMKSVRNMCIGGCYLGSLFFCLYFALWNPSYIFVVVSISVQVVSLFYLLMTYVSWS